MAFDALRHPEYKFAAAKIEFTAARLIAAIENEDRTSAEALVNRTFDDGLHWEDLDVIFVQAALAHFNDFGHSLIYVYKTRQLAELLPEVERELALALVRSLCYATREDLISEFSSYDPALEQLQGAVSVRSDTDPVPAACPFPASTQDALDWTVENLPGRNVALVYDRLLEALARNLLH